MASDAERRAAINRLPLLMVGEFHSRGFQRLRAYCALSPSGMHWRCSVGPSCVARAGKGALIAWDSYKSPLIAHYTSAAGTEYFGVEGDGFTAPQLADAFSARYPETLARAAKEDPAYVDWFASLLELTTPDLLPFALADFDIPKDRLSYVTTGTWTDDVFLPLPPPSLDAGDCRSPR